MMQTKPLCASYYPNGGCWVWRCTCDECNASEQQQCYGPFESEKAACRDLEETVKVMMLEEEVKVEQSHPEHGCQISQTLIAFRIMLRDRGRTKAKIN